MNMLAFILLATNDSLGETFARGAGKGIGGLIVLGFLCLIIWIVKKIMMAFGYKSKTENTRREKEDEISRIRMRAEIMTEEARKRNEQQALEDEQREKIRIEEEKKEKSEKEKKEAEEAQQKEDARILAAMNELETGNLDKLTWGKALIAADGDEKRAKVEYLKTRRFE